MAKKQETGLTLAQVRNVVSSAIEKKKKDAPKRRPITENPTYIKLQEKLDASRRSLAKAKEKAADVYTENAVVGNLIKWGASIPYGWVRNKTKLLDKLPGSTLANGSIPDFIVGSTALGLGLYSKGKGWNKVFTQSMLDLSDIAMVSSGLRLGSSIKSLDNFAATINAALDSAGTPGAPPVDGVPQQLSQRFTF